MTTTEQKFDGALSDVFGAEYGTKLTSQFHHTKEYWFQFWPYLSSSQAGKKPRKRGPRPKAPAAQPMRISSLFLFSAPAYVQVSWEGTTTDEFQPDEVAFVYRRK